jgi:hypothetical protein
MNTLLGIAVGIGLSAACGFRVFLPLFGLSLAAQSGVVALSAGFSWLATPVAAVALGTATVAEVVAYYVPWLDHLLDLLATPVAVLAGMLATASVVIELPPLLRWAVVLIGGGSAAGLVQGASVLLRLKASATTGGAANPAVATAELAGAGITTALALWVPLLCLLVVVASLAAIFRRVGRLAFGTKAAQRAERRLRT